MITSQYIQISNHYVIYLQLMLHVNYTSIKKKERKGNKHHSSRFSIFFLVPCALLSCKRLGCTHVLAKDQVLQSLGETVIN